MQVLPGTARLVKSKPVGVRREVGAADPGRGHGALGEQLAQRHLLVEVERRALVGRVVDDALELLARVGGLVGAVGVLHRHHRERAVAVAGGVVDLAGRDHLRPVRDRGRAAARDGHDRGRGEVAPHDGREFGGRRGLRLEHERLGLAGRDGAGRPGCRSAPLTVSGPAVRIVEPVGAVIWTVGVSGPAVGLVTTMLRGVGLAGLHPADRGDEAVLQGQGGGGHGDRVRARPGLGRGPVAGAGARQRGGVVVGRVDGPHGQRGVHGQPRGLAPGRSR